MSVCDGIGPIRFLKLLQYFGSARNSSLKEMKESGTGDKISEDLIDFKTTFSLSEYEERLQKLQVIYYTLQDEDYPQLLKQIKNPS